MRVCVVTGGTLPVPPVRGGAVEVLVDAYLKSDEASRHEFVVYSSYAVEAESRTAGYSNCSFRFVDTSSFRFCLARAVRGAVNRLLNGGLASSYIHSVARDLRSRHESFDVVLVENRPDFVRHVVGVVDGTPLVLHLHNDLVNEEVGARWGALTRVSEVVGVSDFICQRVRSARTSVPVRPVLNGVDLGLFRPGDAGARRRVREQYGLPEPQLVVLFVGRVVESKGVEELLEAFDRLPRAENVTLIIGGSARFGSNRRSRFVRRMQRRVARKSLNVVFTGYLPRECMRDLYQGADIVVVPSITTEAISLVVIEAMASGLPVIGSDSGGIPELLGQGGGVIVPRGPAFVPLLARAMLNLLENDEARVAMGVLARNRVASLSLERYSREFDEALRDVVARGRQRS